MSETKPIPLSTTIRIVNLDPGLLTSYGPRGATRDGKGQPFREADLALTANRGGGWRAAPAMAADLLALDGAWLKETGRRLRLTDVFRDGEVQANARRRYETWIAAGSPPPGSARFSKATMKTDFVAPVNGSNHQWGGAVDFDIAAVAGGTDEGLAQFWRVAKEYGFRPIIAHPHLGQSEAWHFDHHGPLSAVLSRYKREPGAPAYTRTAMLACILAGTFVGDRKMERYAQARIALGCAPLPDGGPWPGDCDGYIGKQTRAAFAALCPESKLPSDAPPSDYIAVLDAGGIGLDLLAGI